MVLDGDLGILGRFSDTKARESYKQLVARVCLGEVGAIFGLEIARLARPSAELQRLLEFCGLTDTLVVDTDGMSGQAAARRTTSPSTTATDAQLVPPG